MHLQAAHITVQTQPAPPSEELPSDERKRMKTTLNTDHLNPHPILYHGLFPNMEIFFPLTSLFLLVV